MLAQTSYQVSRFAADGDAEKQRLNAQVDLFWRQELDLYRGLGMGHGMKVLDCGCATGYLLEKLKSAFPEIDCTGIDQDPELIAAATERLGHLAGCRFLECSACGLELPENTFDFAVARLVLEHLPNPSAALNELFRVLKPGGSLVVIDNDFDLHERTWPDCPSLGPLYAAYRSARRTDGGNPCIGRELPKRLIAAGFSEVSLTLLAAHNQVDGDQAFRRAEGAGIPAQLVKDGYLSPVLLDQIAAEWVYMLESPGHCIFRMLFAAVGRKPAGGLNGAQAQPAEVSSTERSSGAPLVAPENGTLQSSEGIRHFIQNVLAAEMDVPAESLPCGESLLHLGVDSLAAMRLCNQIKTRLQLSISMADVLCGKSIEELTEEILMIRQTTPAQSASPQPLNH